ncbi:MAG: protein translocase subunit SecD [Geminicoccaceae bacterium]
MLRFATWQIVFVLGICVLGAVLAVPNLFARDTVQAWPDVLPKGQINLGLDLQGGSHLLLEVDADEVVEERLETLLGDIRIALRTERIRYRGLGVRNGRVIFTLAESTDAESAREQLDELNTNIPVSTAGGGGSLLGGGFGAITAEQFEISQQGDRLSMGFSEEGRDALLTSVLTQSLEVVRRRIDELGTREPTIQRQGADRILVQVPGERDPEAIKRLLGQTARLTFHMVEPGVTAGEVRDGSSRAGLVVFPSDETDEDGNPVFEWVVDRKVELSGENLTNSQPTFQDNQPVVSFTFDTTGARKFGQITSENVGALFAIVLDDKVISAPEIQEPILGGNGIISGSFTVESANELALLLRAGALPAPLNVLEERSVGPDLGADSIAAGEIAGVIAVVAVCLFMGAYYGIFGLVAVAALLVNLVLIAGALSVLGATLTLPGIAGIVLTIGMAVDANVLIFERIREEARIGKGPVGAIESGYKQAMRTIIDANITTLIAALLLFQFGSGPVKGFAVTLAIGIVTSMFTAITFARLLVSVWYQRTRPKTLPI